MPRETGESYNSENDALPETEGGYTKEYIEEAIKKWESEIADIEVKRDALKIMIAEGNRPESKKDLEEFNHQIKAKQAIIEKARIKIGELALKKEIETGKYE